MIKGKYAFNLIRIFSPKKFDLLTETLYSGKNSKSNIKNKSTFSRKISVITSNTKMKEINK